MSTIKLKGYRRSDSLFGIRNNIVVMSSVSCANSIVERIAKTDTDIIPITHQHGCTHMGADTEQVLRTLSGTCNNPNLGGVLLVGLGCESVSVNDIASRVDGSGKMVLASGTAQAIMLPMLGAAALYFRYRRSDENLRPGLLWDAMLWLSLVGFAVIDGWSLISTFCR